MDKSHAMPSELWRKMKINSGGSTPAATLQPNSNDVTMAACTIIWYYHTPHQQCHTSQQNPTRAAFMFSCYTSLQRTDAIWPYHILGTLGEWLRNIQSMLISWIWWCTMRTICHMQCFRWGCVIRTDILSFDGAPKQHVSHRRIKCIKAKGTRVLRDEKAKAIWTIILRQWYIKNKIK